MCGGKNIRSKIKESGTSKIQKNNATSWTFSESYSSIHVLGTPKSFQRLLQQITVKTVILEHLILTEITTQLQSRIKAQEKFNISFLVKSKQQFGRPKGACSHDMICGKTRNSMQCTQIRVTQMYDLQKLLALEEFRIISRN